MTDERAHQASNAPSLLRAESMCPDATFRLGSVIAILLLGSSAINAEQPLFPNPATGMDRMSYSMMADFNRDGHADVAAVNLDDQSVDILLGNGDGTFRFVDSIWIFGHAPGGVGSADFDGDSSLDLAITLPYSEEVWVCPGAGDGTFECLESGTRVSGAPGAVGTGDFDHDGNEDLLLSP